MCVKRNANVTTKSGFLCRVAVPIIYVEGRFMIHLCKTMCEVTDLCLIRRDAADLLFGAPGTVDPPIILGTLLAAVPEKQYLRYKGECDFPFFKSFVYMPPPPPISCSRCLIECLYYAELLWILFCVS
jgi:hypothetical protein